MPIQIRELIIKATVEQNKSAMDVNTNSANTTEKSNQSKYLLSKEIPSAVFKILNRKNER